MKKIAFVGAGFASSVLARELAQQGDYDVKIFEARSHLAGNCHTARHSETGILVHEYGPHIFNTNREDVWSYINRFGKFKAFVNRVKAVTAKGVFSLPINLLTINQFFGKKFNPREAQEFIDGLGDSAIQDPLSFEEQALKFLGRELYENFFYGYTKKQWGVDPKELPASILKRLPVRFSYDDNYYNKKFQGIPVDGYTSIVERILDHPQIQVELNSKADASLMGDCDHLFWSGPIDSFFNYQFGRLEYRTLEFESFEADGDFQGNAVINYCEEKVPYTRITEHKHFAPWETHEKTICFREFSKRTGEGDTPFYPVRLAVDKERLAQYVDLALKTQAVSFIGRLGTYRYLDMDVTIGESLDFAGILKELPVDQWPQFNADSIG